MLKLVKFKSKLALHYPELLKINSRNDHLGASKYLFLKQSFIFPQFIYFNTYFSIHLIGKNFREVKFNYEAYSFEAYRLKDSSFKPSSSKSLKL